jgi:hypothetical protein
VLDDGLIEFVAAKTNGVRDDHPSKGNYGYLGGSAPDVANHVPGRLMNRDLRADRGSQGLFDNLNLASARLVSAFLNRPVLDVGYATRYADDHPWFYEAMPGHDLGNEIPNHLFGGVHTAMTPSLRGRIAMMLPGVFHNMRLASAPTATTRFVPRSTATTEGSLTTIPLPLT